jgi:hypothetical protein
MSVYGYLSCGNGKFVAQIKTLGEHNVDILPVARAKFATYHTFDCVVINITKKQDESWDSRKEYHKPWYALTEEDFEDDFTDSDNEYSKRGVSRDGATRKRSSIKRMRRFKTISLDFKEGTKFFLDRNQAVYDRLDLSDYTGSYEPCYEDGSPMIVAKYVKGKPDGVYAKYTPDGEVEFTKFYKDGKLDLDFHTQEEQDEEEQHNNNEEVEFEFKPLEKQRKKKRTV